MLTLEAAVKSPPTAVCAVEGCAEIHDVGRPGSRPCWQSSVPELTLMARSQCFKDNNAVAV